MFATRSARKRKLMRNLKSRRGYTAPIPGGKKRTKLSRMSKAERVAKAKLLLVESPISITSSVSIVKAVPAKNQIFGWASVVTTGGFEYTDMEGHSIDLEDLEKAAYDSIVLLAKGEAANDTHSPGTFGRMIESMVYTPEKIEALGLPSDFQQGWWVGLELPPERYATVTNGDRLMFSIEGSAKLEPVS